MPMLANIKSLAQESRDFDALKRLQAVLQMGGRA